MRYDVLIRGGMIADGNGGRMYQADVAVRDGRIAAIGQLMDDAANEEINAQGLVVSPGFIDSHAHSDTSFVKDSSCASKLYQGITTEVTGQCGDSPFPAQAEETDPWRCTSFDAFVKKFEAEGRMTVNQAILVGHGSLREAVMGYADRPASAEELSQMKQLLRRDLQAGAWGMSLGLEYAPGFFAEADELAELAKVVKEFDGLVPCHMRSEGLQIDKAIDELVQIGRTSGAHVHISHLKIDNYRVHGRAAEVWRRICDARESGVNITCDMYPYTASCTSLTIRCPKWSREGGDEALLRRLQGSERKEIVEGIRSHYFSAERAETCLFNNDGGYWPEIVGRTLRDVAENDLHTTDYAEAAAEVLVRTRCRAGGIFFVMSEEDMLYFMRQDVGIGSDGYALPADSALVGSKPHPRSYGTIPEFFRLARENKLCTVEEAVRRVTSKPADMIGLTDRGRLKVGNTADITVFDPETIAPRATYLEHVQTAQGVKHVLVGGVLALKDGVQTPARAGCFLRKR